MAVEIPVYVDIRGAFEQAARDVPKEIPKLEKAISSQALKIDFGGDNMRTLLTDSSITAGRLRRALREVRQEFDAVNSGAQKARRGMNVDNLIKSYALLEQRLTGTFNQPTVLMMKTEATIGKVSAKINKLKASLSAATPGTDLFNKTNYELQLQQQRLSQLNMQLMRYRAGVNETTAAFSRQSSIVRQLSGYFSGIYAAHALLRFVKQVRDVTGELEYQQIALGHILQDRKAGDELFERTIEAAKQSPFRIGELVTYTKQLAAYRIEQEDLFDTTQRLADISAGLGVDMNRLILAYGQVRAASVLRGQELRQFTEAGIPLVEELAKKFTKLKGEMVSTADVFKLISERAVPFEYIKEIFEEMTNAGGMFYKMQETQAETLKGRWEKLKDAFDQALMSLGNSDTFQGWNDDVLKILNGIAKNLKGVVKTVNAGAVAWAAYWVATKSGLNYGVRLTAEFIKEYGAVTTLKFGVNSLALAFKRLWLAMKANWVGLAISAVAGLITFFTTFRKKTEEANEELSDMQKSIEAIKEANKKFEFEKELIDNYDSLSKLTERTATQSEQLASAIDELKRIYPELADKIGDTNVPLAEQAELLKNAAEDAHKLAVEEAKNQLETQKDIIRGLEQEEAAAKQALDAARRRHEEAKASEALGERYEETYGLVTKKTAEGLKNETIEAAKAAKAAEDNYEAIAEKLAIARREAEELEKVAFPNDAQKKLTGWRKMLMDARKYISEGLPKEIYTEADVKSWETLGEAIKKLKPAFEEARKTYVGLVAAVKEGGALVRPDLVKERDAAKDAFDTFQALDTMLGGLLSKKETHGSDSRLSNLKKDISEVTNAYKKFLELRKYMSNQKALDEIGILFPQLNGLEPTLESTIQKIQSFLQNYKGPKDKVYLEMQRAIDTEISNLKFDDLKKKIDEELKNVSERIKRSESARNFYQNILGLTGDENLAATLSVSVYGGIGEEFKDRIKNQLVEALNTLDSESFSGLEENILKAFNVGDYEYLRRNLEKVPEKLRDVVKTVSDDADKYNSEIISSYAKLLMKFDEVRQKSIDIENKADQDIKTLREGLALEIKGINENAAIQDKDAAIKAAEERVAAVEAGVNREKELNQFRLKREYRMFFESIGVLSLESARKVARAERAMVTAQFEAGEISLSKFERELDRIEERLRKYEDEKNPFVTYLSKGIDGLVEKIKQAGKNLSGIAGNLKDDEGFFNMDEDTMAYIDKLGAVFGGDLFGVSGRKNVFAKAMAEYGPDPEAWSKVLNQAEEKLEKMGSEMSQGIGWANFWVSFAGNGIKAFDKIAQKSKNVEGEVKEGWDKFAKGLVASVAGLIVGDPIVASIAGILGAEKMDVDDAWERFTSVNEKAMSGFEKFKSGDIIGAIIDNIEGWSEFFGKNTKEIDRQINELNKLLQDLEYQYSRLDVAIQKAFGSDYIYHYNKQVEALKAEAEAYRKQAELEQSKGDKKRDQDKIDEYNKQARAVEDKISDMQSQLSEFFAGTDLTSAAKDFANSWIEAYKQFGNTTDAMKEKFQSMIQEMVVNSLAADIMQRQLAPIFKMINELSQDDGMLSAADVASIAAKANETMPMINDAMTTLMSELTAAGYNLRQQTTQFTGISRNIAGATEESINGLAAGINTQNFYMQHIDMTVTMILEALTGESATGARKSQSGTSTNPYQDQMLEYASSIPLMRDDMYAIRSMLERVIRPNASKAEHYVSVRM